VAINLLGATRKVESFMTETCDVWPPEDVHSYITDPITLELVLPPAIRLYTDGACKAKDFTTMSRGRGVGDSEGGNDLLIVGAKIDFPIGDVPDAGFPEGSLIKMKSSLRMPQLVGVVFVLRQSILKTFAIQYSVLADRRKQVDAG
jgi:hypothetical protein